MSTATEVRRKFEVKKAPRYCNVFYNNEKTTMEFVLVALKEIFDLSFAEAQQKVMEIHESTKGVVFIASKEICEHKHTLMDMFCQKVGEMHLQYEVEPYEDEE
jgi:ATP-dependent Clp protease adapter protein ClpS